MHIETLFVFDSQWLEYLSPLGIIKDDKYWFPNGTNYKTGINSHQRNEWPAPGVSQLQCDESPPTVSQLNFFR